MTKQLTVNSLTELRTHLNNIDSNLIKNVFILFTGDKNLPDGSSWCPDCNDADPVIKESVKLLSDDSQFITCFVGDRPKWKNQDNEYRTDKEFKISSVPTLILWKTKKQLAETQCADKSLVEMLFEESV